MKLIADDHVEILHICYYLYFKIKFLKEEDKFIEV